MEKNVCDILRSCTLGTGTALKPILNVKDRLIVSAALSRDTATKERRLCLVFIYPDGLSDVKQYRLSKLTSPTALRDLLDMDGMTEGAIKNLYAAIMKHKDTLVTQADNAGKQPLVEVYRELCDYVRTYCEPGRVFVRGEFGYIHSAVLQRVIDRLQLGYARLELEKALKLMGLLVTSENSGHPYSCAVNIKGRTEWFLAFKLPNTEQEVVYEQDI